MFEFLGFRDSMDMFVLEYDVENYVICLWLCVCVFEYMVVCDLCCFVIVGGCVWYGIMILCGYSFYDCVNYL